MNVEVPYGNQITFLVNLGNLSLGFITPSDFNVLSGLFGLLFNLVYFLYKFYRTIQLDQASDGHQFDQKTVMRSCPNCWKQHEVTDPTQIFCGEKCFNEFRADAKSRKPKAPPSV